MLVLALLVGVASGDGHPLRSVLAELLRPQQAQHTVVTHSPHHRRSTPSPTPKATKAPTPAPKAAPKNQRVVQNHKEQRKRLNKALAEAKAWRNFHGEAPYNRPPGAGPDVEELPWRSAVQPAAGRR